MAAAALLCAAALLRHPATAASRYTLIIVSPGNRTVYEVDPDSGRVMHALALAGEPADAAVSPDGNTIYVTQPGSVDAVDARTFRVHGRIASLPAGATPYAEAITDDGTKLYVGVGQRTGSALLAVDLAGHATRTIALGVAGGRFFGIQLGTNLLYYPAGPAQAVLVIDTESDRKTATIPVKGGPADVAFAPNGEVWVQNDADGSVAIVNSMDNRVRQVIATDGRGPGRIAVSPSGQYAAATHGETEDVAVFDARTHRLAGTVHLGTGPSFPIFSADSTKLFVLNSGAGDVAVIDSKTLNVTARWRIGTDPSAGALRYLARG